MEMQEQRETQVRRWFSMWLCKQDTGLEELFAPDAVYIESWGPEYHGSGKIKLWFETVDTTPEGYRLLALSFDGTKPRFGKNAKVQAIENQKLTVYYTSQCPYIHQSVELVRKTCEELEAPCTLIPVDTLEKAKALPCVFNNWAVFYQGKFVTVNLLDAAALKRLLKQ